jgi:CheY-like chemotaxis protein
VESRPTILLVDDDPDVIDQLKLMMKAEGYDVVAAAGQQEAEEALMSHKPDLAIVDVLMEEHDSGFILCHEIKKLYPGTPVILLTSVKSHTGMSLEATTSEQQSWVKADRMMDKPARPEQLKNEVRRLLATAAQSV